MISEMIASLANEFHRLDRALFPKADPSGRKVIQFTSSRSGEGVTSMVLAFAGFLSNLHGSGTVVAVEANLRNPSFATQFGLRNPKGLIDGLEESAKLEEIILTAEPYDFSIIPAGMPGDRSKCGNIESCLDHIATTLDGLKGRYHYIILDAPPLIPYIDSTVLAEHTDGCVIVVEANETRSEVLEEATERLKPYQDKILGIILNKREFHIPQWLYRLL
jgi:Mrp family chromosome partitioning ATPase